MLTSPRLIPLGAVAAALLMSTTAVASSPTCTIRGSERSDTLTGGPGRDVICGHGGNDTLRGLGGDDVLLGGDGHDRLDGGDGNDSASGGAGSDTLRGGLGDDDLSGDAGEDLFVAEAAPDGADDMRGGSGYDAVTYAARGGAVQVTLGGGADDGAAGEGDDVSRVQGVSGGAGADQLVGSGADEALAGLGGNDVLDGGAGWDAFVGGAGNDAVRARDGRRDALIDCGSGKDTATADGSDPRAYGCEAAAEVPKADLSVTLADAPDPVVEGEAAEYRLSVRNAGPDTATGVSVATTLPADATAEPASGCSTAGAVVTCSVPDLAAGGSSDRTLSVRHGAPGRKSVTSTVRSDVQDANAANDSATETTAVEPKPAPAGAGLSVSVSDDADPAAVLEEVSYTVAVTNAGPLAADAVSLVLDIDESWSAITRPSGCTQTMFPTTKLTCSLGSLAAGATATKVPGVSWSEAGAQTVKATVSSTTADPHAADNTETETTTVN